MGYGVAIGTTTVPSVSHADDVALVAGSGAGTRALISAYLRWCALLDLEITKVQLWWNGRGPRQLQVDSLAVETSPVLRRVMVVLAAQEAAASAVHLEKWLPKVLDTAQRLRSLDVPTSLAAHLWKATVLPQALYSCEVQNVRAVQLAPLTMLGRNLLAAKGPLKLTAWRVPEVPCGPPLGNSALVDLVWKMRCRQFRWLQLVANLPGLVGDVHREVACLSGAWEQLSMSLRASLGDVGWRVVRNEACLRAVRWPFLLQEVAYGREIRLVPVDDVPEGWAVFTDGSVSGRSGGAAAVMPDRDEVRQLRVLAPRAAPTASWSPWGWRWRRKRFKR